jgi:multidrug transporter EmrE-like cation transporter
MPTFDLTLPAFGLALSDTTRAYCKLVFCASLLAGAELLLKIGAVAGAAASDGGTVTGAALGQLTTWLGIALYIANFVTWLDVLRTTPVGVAYAVQSIVQLMVPVGAWAVLSEQITAGRALGIGLVFAGVLLAAAPSALADEKL